MLYSSFCPAQINIPSLAQPFLMQSKNIPNSSSLLTVTIFSELNYYLQHLTTAGQKLWFVSVRYFFNCLVGNLMSLVSLMQILETLIFSKVNHRSQAKLMQAQDMNKNISISQLQQKDVATLPDCTHPPNIQEQHLTIPNTTNQIISLQNPISIHLQNVPASTSTTVAKPKRQFFRPHEQHRIKASIQSEKSKNQQLILQDKIEVNQMTQQATHLQIHNSQKQNEDQKSITSQLNLQTKLEPVEFIVLVQAIQQNQAMEMILMQQNNERMKQKSKRMENSKQIIEDRANLRPVSFKIILKLSSDQRITSCKDKQLDNQRKAQRAAIQTSRKSYLSNQTINKYPMILKNISLEGLLSQVYQNRLISMGLFDEWIKNKKNIAQAYFLKLFSQQRLEQFPFDKIKFTLLDHRRLSEVLFSLFPQKYRLGEMTTIQNEQRQFIAGIYDISAEQYYELCSGVDKISKVKWWVKLVIVHQNRLSGIVYGIQQKQQKQPIQQRNLFQEFFNTQSNNPLNILKQIKVPSQKTYFRLNQTFHSAHNILQDKGKIIIKPKPKKGKQEQISQIRNLVSGFGKRRIEVQQGQQNPRKKIKFS